LFVAGALVGAFGWSMLHHHGDRATPGTPDAVDIGFSQDMIVHHQQAITMVAAIGARGGAQIRPIADTIRTEQLGEIGMMNGWLAVWGAAPLSSAAPMAWMSDHAAASGGAMPGMASQADLDQLVALTGHAAASRFLQLMIRHHDGGIAMATYASTHARTEVVRAAAERMILDERQEISLMTQLLALG
jgi:uncharacterized protein (DUF305 family)